MATGTTFIIYNTAGQPVSAIQPNTLDGPNGVQQNSDLRMYGLGYPNWGEGVNENDYHIIESFACPPLSNFPTSARYILLGPTVSAITPAGQATDELGSGNGINHPVIGQLWYNTTTSKLFVNTTAYPTATWTTVGTQAVAIGTMPLTPTLGQLWYDAITVPSQPQLKIYNGTSFVSVAEWYLPLSGGTLSGILIMGSTINMNSHQINNLATGTTSLDAVNLQQMNSAIAGSASLYLPTAGGTMTGTLNMSGAQIITNSSINLTGSASVGLVSGSISWSSNPIVAVNVTGGRIINIGNPTAVTDAITYQSADPRYVNIVDNTAKSISAPITFTNAAPPISAAAPTIGSHLTNKTYVDSKILTSGLHFLPSGQPYLFFSGGSQPSWTTFNATAAGVPIGATGVIIYAYATVNHPNGVGNPKFVCLRVDNTKGNVPGTPWTDTYNVLYNYTDIAFGTTVVGSSCNQGTYPLRAAGTFDYITYGNWEAGLALYIVGYYV